ncbi:MAG: class I SAM-dependent methyltransferase [Labedaea sp.]
MQWTEFVNTRAKTEWERLTALESIFDAVSLRNLDRAAVRPGSRCLEVGAGAGSIARWMGELAGPGNVVATDLSTEFLDHLTELGIEVMHHDVTVDEPPGEFDVIHSRFVLDHLPDRDEAIKRLAAWLRPGGWLVVECATIAPEMSSHPAVRRALESLGAVLSSTVGTHPTWARSLPVPLEAAGLTGCGAEGVLLPARGGSPLASWLKATHMLIERPAVESGLISRDELDEAYATYDSPSLWTTPGSPSAPGAGEHPTGEVDDRLRTLRCRGTHRGLQ